MLFVIIKVNREKYVEAWVNYRVVLVNFPKELQEQFKYYVNDIVTRGWTGVHGQLYQQHEDNTISFLDELKWLDLKKPPRCLNPVSLEASPASAKKESNVSEIPQESKAAMDLEALQASWASAIHTAYPHPNENDF